MTQRLKQILTAVIVLLLLVIAFLLWNAGNQAKPDEKTTQELTEVFNFGQNSSAASASSFTNSSFAAFSTVPAPLPRSATPFSAANSRRNFSLSAPSSWGQMTVLTLKNNSQLVQITSDNLATGDFGYYLQNFTSYDLSQIQQSGSAIFFWNGERLNFLANGSLNFQRFYEKDGQIFWLLHLKNADGTGNLYFSKNNLESLEELPVLKNRFISSIQTEKDQAEKILINVREGNGINPSLQSYHLDLPALIDNSQEPEKALSQIS